ncbi:hypothetical protein TNCV_4597201 [Trichonephila clavipes]|uniref:Uncharacterized protein n=1 Tax=Trichonephila clavipes TaxID=2585209 RepID=A0A8X6WFE0_TRICX|nr:hypothetical protein TNCV_4597201 [Trichonephila clavipes]
MAQRLRLNVGLRWKASYSHADRTRNPIPCSLLCHGSELLWPSLQHQEVNHYGHVFNIMEVKHYGHPSNVVEVNKNYGDDSAMIWAVTMLDMQTELCVFQESTLTALRYGVDV